MRLFPSLAVGVVVAATLGLTAAQAQDAQPPANNGPYYLVTITDEILIFVAGGTLEKSGNIASVTVVTGSSPATLAETGFARLDSTYRFNCNTRTFMTPVYAVYGPNNDLVGALEENEGWESVNAGSPAEAVLAYACNGTIPPDGELEADSPNAIVGFYRDFITNQ